RLFCILEIALSRMKRSPDRDAGQIDFELAEELPVRAPPAKPAAPTPPAPRLPPAAPPAAAPPPPPFLLAPPAPVEPPLPVDGMEAARVAGYGPPPRGVLEAALYVWNVVQRRASLRAALADRKRALADVEVQEAAALERVVESARATVGE